MPTSPLHGLNLVPSTPPPSNYLNDQQDLLAAPPFPELALWTNLAFESDDPLVKAHAPGVGGLSHPKFSVNSKGDEHSPSSLSEDREDCDRDGDEATHAEQGDVRSQEDNTTSPPPFDLNAILAGIGVDPFLVPPPSQSQAQGHHQNVPIAQQLDQNPSAVQPQPPNMAAVAAAASLAHLLAAYPMAHSQAPPLPQHQAPQNPPFNVPDAYLQNLLAAPFAAASMHSGGVPFLPPPTAPTQLPLPQGQSSGDSSATSSSGNSAKKPRHITTQNVQQRKSSIVSPASPTSPASPSSSVLSTPMTASEDKRRRNTAASARFRAKKKEREAALERRAGELDQRVSELERECEALRRENGWLRGLVVGVTGASGVGGKNLPTQITGKRKRGDTDGKDKQVEDVGASVSAQAKLEAANAPTGLASS